MILCNVLYRIESGKIRTRGIEFAAADHCNLRCSGCSHMSPFLGGKFHSLEEFERDFRRLATVLLADEVRIVGGEPLLNPQIVEILKAARACGIAQRVVLTTNGLLLHTMPAEFWSHVDEVRMNLYPRSRPTSQLVTQARERAERNKVALHVSEYFTFRTTLVTEPHPADAITGMIYRTCQNAHLNHCHMVSAGWIYKCACPAYMEEYLGNLGQSGYAAARDGFEIHAAVNLREQLWEYLTCGKPLDACRYCLGHVGKLQPHHQLTAAEARAPGSVRITRKTHLSKHLLARESLNYWKRRAVEMVTRTLEW